MTQDELIQKRVEEKNKRIKEYRSETQLSIQLGQAVNLAHQEMVARQLSVTEREELFDRLVNFFMSYLDKKRKEVFDQNEKMYAENPAPTVEQYENMTEVQKKFYKDKQLESNRKKYAENKKVGFIKRKPCPDCGQDIWINATSHQCQDSVYGVGDERGSKFEG